MSPNCFGLPDKAVEMIHGVLRKHSAVDCAVLYGSRAKGNFKNGSDIDLTLHGETMEDAEFMQILDELDDLLLPWQMDVSLLHQINHAALLDHISRVGKIFYQRQSANPSRSTD